LGFNLGQVVDLAMFFDVVLAKVGAGVELNVLV
jgi:hypothetical protein